MSTQWPASKVVPASAVYSAIKHGVRPLNFLPPEGVSVSHAAKSSTTRGRCNCGAL